MRVIHLILFVLSIVSVSAAETSSTSYKEIGTTLSGGDRITSTSYSETGALGDPLVGEMSSTSYQETAGVFGAGTYEPPPAEGPTGGGNGGGTPDAGCAEGYIKTESGQCIQEIKKIDYVAQSKEDLNSAIDYISNLGSKIYPEDALVGWGILSITLGGLVFVFQKYKNKKEQKKTNDQIKRLEEEMNQ